MTVTVEATALHWRPGGAVVLDGVELSVEPGSLCVLLGPNGSGKTSTLRCLARLLAPDAGTVLYDRASITGQPTRALGARRAFVSQDQPAELELTVLDLVLIGRTPHKRRLDPDRAEDLAIARRSLADVDLAAFETRALPTLSGGERQRAFVARALAQQAPLLLLDEPTNHLDLRHQHELLALLRDAAATAIVSLHDPQLAATYADQIVVVHDGRAVAAGPPAAVLTDWLLRDVWGVRAEITTDPSGRPRLHVLGIDRTPAEPGRRGARQP